MANTKTVKKTQVVAESSTEQETQSVIEEQVVQKTPVAKSHRKFEATDVIKCRSITYGELLLPSVKNKDMLYSWSDYGDEHEVEYQDLRALRSKRSQYIYGPLFIIEDEDLLDEWIDLKDLYQSVTIMDLDKLFNLPVNEMSRKLQAMPQTLKETIKNAASARILSGELDSLSKIRAIDSILGTDLCFYIH